MRIKDVVFVIIKLHVSKANNSAPSGPNQWYSQHPPAEIKKTGGLSLNQIHIPSLIPVPIFHIPKKGLLCTSW